VLEHSSIIHPALDYRGRFMDLPQGVMMGEVACDPPPTVQYGTVRYTGLRWHWYDAGHLESTKNKHNNGSQKYPTKTTPLGRWGLTKVLRRLRCSLVLSFPIFKK